MTGSALMVDQRYLYVDFDRHRNRRLYFRRREGGKYRKVRLREPEGTEEFHEEFAAAIAGRPYGVAAQQRPAPPRVVANSLRWLTEEYFRRSAEFKAYDTETQKARRNVLKALCAEPVTQGSTEEVGDLPYDIPEDKIVLLRDRKSATPDAANARIKALRQVYKWAVSLTPKLLERNTAASVSLLKATNSDGHHTWSIEEIERYKKRHPAGTKAHLALMLFLLLGQRISDVAVLGKQHIRKPEHVAPPLRRIHQGRWLAFRQHKNRASRPVDLIIPILPELEAAIASPACGAMTFLETEHGSPHSVKGLGNWFADRCMEAKVPGRGHGLRKAGATIAAENGATPHQMMAIFGWKKLEQAEVYTKKARQQVLAGGAMNLIAYGQIMNECDPPAKQVGKSGSMSGKKESKING